MSVFCIIVLLAIARLEVAEGFTLHNNRAVAPTFQNRNAFRSSPSSSRLNSFVDISSALIAVGDYAAEIEKGVGEEIYAPIFKSGLVLFGSGLISAFMAAAIIAKSNSWEELGLEFERGKVAQLIELEVNTESVTAPVITEEVTIVAAPVAAASPLIPAMALAGMPSSSSPSVPSTPVRKESRQKVSASSSRSDNDGVYDMDI